MAEPQKANGYGREKGNDRKRIPMHPNAIRDSPEYAALVENTINPTGYKAKPLGGRARIPMKPPPDWAKPSTGSAFTVAFDSEEDMHPKWRAEGFPNAGKNYKGD